MRFTFEEQPDAKQAAKKLIAQNETQSEKLSIWPKASLHETPAHDFKTSLAFALVLCSV